MTVYRVGDDTPFVQSLIRAAEAGKQVACVIELNARFDEERNLHWSRELEKVGAHVVFGVSGLKTHSKAALVIRQEETGIRAYAHIGTGNYHARTASLYEDLGLLTADPAVTRDVVTLFHFLTGRSRTPVFEKLVVAPMTHAHRVRPPDRARDHKPRGRAAGTDRLQAEPARGSRDLPTALAGRRRRACRSISSYAACAASPLAFPGLTENLRVRSIIGRFLEHSRIYHFAAGSDDPLEGEFLIGSADWMHRNLSERVEAAVPIAERRLRARLWEILQICLADTRTAWQMQPDGRYLQLRPHADDSPGSEGTHATLMRLALAGHTI